MGFALVPLLAIMSRMQHFSKTVHAVPGVSDLNKPIKTSTEMCRTLHKQPDAISVNAFFTEEYGVATFQCFVNRGIMPKTESFVCDMRALSEIQNVLYVFNGVASCYPAHHSRSVNFSKPKINKNGIISPSQACAQGPSLLLEEWSTFVTGWVNTTTVADGTSGASGSSSTSSQTSKFKYLSLLDLDLHRTVDNQASGMSAIAPRPRFQISKAGKAHQWAAFWEICGTTSEVIHEVTITIAFTSVPEDASGPNVEDGANAGISSAIHA